MEMLKQPDLKGWNVKVDVATLISNKIYHIIKVLIELKTSYFRMIKFSSLGG